MALFNSLQLSCWYFLENQISFQLSTFPLSQKWSTYSICRIESPRFSLWCFFAPVFSVGQIERAWRENFTSYFATRCCSPPPPCHPPPEHPPPHTALLHFHTSGFDSQCGWALRAAIIKFRLRLHFCSVQPSLRLQPYYNPFI